MDKQRKDTNKKIQKYIKNNIKPEVLKEVCLGELMEINKSVGGEGSNFVKIGVQSENAEVYKSCQEDWCVVVKQIPITNVKKLKIVKVV